MLEKWSDMELLVKYGEFYRKFKQQPTKENEEILLILTTEFI
jgi:hypothetical protein